MQPNWRYIDMRVGMPPMWTHLRPYGYSILAEIAVALVYFFLIYYLISHIAKNKISSKSLRSHFIYGWLSRVAGGLFIYMFYLLYYGGGDTINYINDSQVMVNMLYEMPLEALYYFSVAISKKSFLDALLIANDAYYFAIYQSRAFLTYLIDYNSEMVALFTVPFMAISAGARYATLIVVSTVSFLSSWLIYLVFVRQYPRYSRILSLPLLYLPSLNVWTGSPFKETYAMIGVGFLVYGVYQLLKRGSWGWLPPMILGAWMAYVVKPYVALAILPWIMIWIYFSLNKRIHHPLYRYFFSPLILILFIGTSYFGIVSLGEQTKKYSLENIPGQAYLVYIDLKQNYTYYQETGGSVYDIGDFEPTIGGMLSKFPIATVTAIFRPFLWEAGKPVIMLAALETFILLSLTLVNIFRYGVVGILRKGFSDSFLIFCFGYSVFFLFMVGLTSGNFGNLVRYRVPGYIFFMGGLFVTFGRLRDESYRRRGWQ